MVFTTEALYIVTTAKKGESSNRLEFSVGPLTMCLHSETPRTPERGQSAFRNTSARKGP